MTGHIFSPDARPAPIQADAGVPKHTARQCGGASLREMAPAGFGRRFAPPRGQAGVLFSAPHPVRPLATATKGGARPGGREAPAGAGAARVWGPGGTAKPARLFVARPPDSRLHSAPAPCKA